MDREIELGRVRIVLGEEGAALYVDGDYVGCIRRSGEIRIWAEVMDASHSTLDPCTDATTVQHFDRRGCFVFRPIEPDEERLREEAAVLRGEEP